jgi:pimeloyl-ACP methyl ester carboxylesterase
MGQNEEIDAQEIFAPADNAPGRIVQVNGRGLHVLTMGKPFGDPTGAPIVLLHGFSAAGHATWLPWANRLAAKRTVILVDMLNFGHSERVTGAHTDLTHQGQAGLVNDLLDTLGVAEIDLVGWSMGGAIATQFTLDYPERVRALIYIAAHVYGADRFNPFKYLGDLPLGVGRALTWNSMGGSANGRTAQSCATTGEQCDWKNLLLITDTVDGLRAISATEQITRLPDDIELIDKPTLVIAGEIDTIVPRADSEKLAATLDAELFIAEGAGHWPGEANPALIAQVVLDFFAANAPRRRSNPTRVNPRHQLTGEY